MEGKRVSLIPDHPRLKYLIDGEFEKLVSKYYAKQSKDDIPCKWVVNKMQQLNVFGNPIWFILDERVNMRTKKGAYAEQAALRKLTLAASILTQENFDALLNEIDIRVFYES